MILNYIGLGIGLGIAAVLLRFAYDVWRFRPTIGEYHDAVERARHRRAVKVLRALATPTTKGSA